MDRKSNFKLDAIVVQAVNFAFQQNITSIVREITIHNLGSSAVDNVVLNIEIGSNFAAPFHQNISYIPSNQTITVKEVPFVFHLKSLSELSQRFDDILKVSLLSEEGILLAECTYPITILAFDEWQGTTYFPELLSSFVTPNRPETVEIIDHAAVLLKTWTKTASLDGYKSQNPNRVRLQAAAVFAALQEQKIACSMPLMDFEQIGQRISFCEMIMQKGTGTCLDLALFYVGCLEYLGLNPLLIFKKGKLFVGLWLENTSFQEIVQDDSSCITRRIDGMTAEIVVVECNSFAVGRSIQFDGAEKMAVMEILNGEPLDVIIDLRRARLNNILPLPKRIFTETGWQAQLETSESVSLVPVSDSQGLAETIKIPENNADVLASLSRKAEWERSLLDLSLHNPLLNLQPSQTMLPILISPVSLLEDALSSGGEFEMIPQPSDWKTYKNRGDVEMLRLLGVYEERIRAEFQNKRLYSSFGEQELPQTLLSLYYHSRESLDERAENNLYLALGLLRWYENSGSEKACYAPIILLPVEIIRKSSDKSFSIHLRKEESKMNAVLLETLKRDFGIIVEGINPTSHDSIGIDVQNIFGKVRQSITGKNRWDILEVAVLGIFPYSQFIMWSDLRSRSETLPDSLIVKSLMNGRSVWDSQDMKVDEELPADDVFQPVALDESQLFAVRAAAEGQSFLLYGPPGTGKSQTITSIIANTLAKGKTVLFASGKTAALSAVWKRLEQIGISPFCLELYAGKLQKNDILEHLRYVIELNQELQETEYIRQTEKVSGLQKELEAFYQALNRIQPCGLSLKEIMERYEANANAGDAIVFTAESAAEIMEGDLERQEQMVSHLIDAASAVDHPYRHPLQWVNASQYTQQMREQLPNMLEEFRTACKTAMEARKAIAILFDRGFRDTRQDWEWFAQVSQQLALWDNLPSVWAKIPNFSEWVSFVHTLAEYEKKAGLKKAALMEHWTPELLSQNGSALENDWKEASSKRFLSRFSKQRKILKHLMPFSRGPINKAEVLSTLSLLSHYQIEQLAGLEILRECKDKIGDLYNGENTDWEMLVKQAEIAGQSVKALENLSGGQEIRLKFASSVEAIKTAEWFYSAWIKFQEASNKLNSLLELQPLEDDEWMVQQLFRCDEIQEGLDSLREWIIWKGLCKEAFHMGLGPVITAYEGGIFHKEVMPCYKKAVYHALAVQTLQAEKLNILPSAKLDGKVFQFRKEKHKLQDLARKEIFTQTALHLMDMSKKIQQRGEFPILQEIFQNNGEGMSLKRLFEQFSTILSHLCPCILTDPLSAAQYLNTNWKPFDLVILDEASQLPTCKAIGVLARGKAAIIAGDLNQIPPVDFPKRVLSNTESILDACLAVKMPRTHLLWHYRSRCESLIAFSNKFFYSNKIYVSPSVSGRESKVQFIHVNGFFDRGASRQNLIEAEAVVAEILYRFREPSLCNASIGVVTFSASQKALIDDLFLEACRQNEGLELWACSAPEPLFIKTLENIQGYERDVILLSVGFGCDQTGRMPVSFGILNRQNGWKYLNTAISRARLEIKVFSSILPKQIDLSRISSEGAAVLKAFLEYSQTGVLEVWKQDVLRRKERWLENSICRVLNKSGYNTQQQIGKSACRIDIGIIDPRDSRRYLAGIQLNSSINQDEFLENLGWRVINICSVDWWKDSRKEMSRILDILEKLKKVPLETAIFEKKKPKVKQTTVELNDKKQGNAIELSESETSLKPSASSLAQTYQAAVLPKISLTSAEYGSDDTLDTVLEKVKAILEIEAPISETLLVKRVLQSCNINRGSSKIHMQNEKVFQRLGVKTTEQDGARFLWRAEQEPDAYVGYRVSGEGIHKRDAKDIPQQETANAICEILEEQPSISKTDLMREAAKRLGYIRTGVLVLTAMERGIDWARKSGRIIVDKADNIFLKR